MDAVTQRILPRCTEQDAVEFCKELWKSVPTDKHTMNHLTSKQHAGAIPPGLNCPENMISFLLSFQRKCRDCVGDMMKAGKTKDGGRKKAVDVLRKCMEGCMDFDISHSDKEIEKRQFLASIVMGNVEATFSEPFGPPGNPCDIPSGTGGRAALKVLPDGKKVNVCFQEILSHWNRLSEDELAVLGLVRAAHVGDPGSRLRCAWTMRPVSWLDIEHGLCKIYLGIGRTTPNYASAAPQHTKFHCHPIKDFVYPKTLMEVFERAVDAWFRLIKASSNSPYMKFPEPLASKRDPPIRGTTLEQTPEHVKERRDLEAPNAGVGVAGGATNKATTKMSSAKRARRRTRKRLRASKSLALPVRRSR